MAATVFDDGVGDADGATTRVTYYTVAAMEIDAQRQRQRKFRGGGVSIRVVGIEVAKTSTRSVSLKSIFSNKNEESMG